MSDPNQPPQGDPFAPPPEGAAAQVPGIPNDPPAYGTPATPPPPPPPAAMPAAPPAYGAPVPAYAAAPPQNGPGTTALVCGIIGLFFCGIILGIIAIIQGRKGKALAAQGLATNGSAANAGFILGIVAIVLNIIGGIFYAVVIAAGSNTSALGF
jgi:hypothetical protein